MEHKKCYFLSSKVQSSSYLLRLTSPHIPTHRELSWTVFDRALLKCRNTEFITARLLLNSWYSC